MVASFRWKKKENMKTEKNVPYLPAGGLILLNTYMGAFAVAEHLVYMIVGIILLPPDLAQGRLSRCVSDV